MARATRIALDLALVSLNTVRPVISKVWSAAKNMITNSPAKPIVHNPVVEKLETTLDKIATMLVAKITIFRDNQLPREQKYLEAELEKVKRKLGATSKNLKPALGIMWQYAKVECVPPMTQGFFAGPAGQKLEDTVSTAADNAIAGIENKIREMDAEEKRVKREKEAEIKAAQDKIKAEEDKKIKEAKMKAMEQQKAKEKEAAAKKSEEDKKAEEKKTEAAKTENKPEKPKPKKQTKKPKKAPNKK